MEFKTGRSGSYYTVLGVRRDASFSDIRSAYRKLAMKWHPDRCEKEPEEAKKRFQIILEAYQVLCDAGKRALYDSGLYDPFDDNDEVEGFSDFVQEMVNLMSAVRREEKESSMEELQGMLREMVHSFDSVPTYGKARRVDSGSSSSSSSSSSRSRKRYRLDEDMIC